jgi:hypothetical protein
MLCLLGGPAALGTVDPQGYFGGMFQVADVGGWNNYPNPVTGSLSCPVGHTRVSIGRVRTSEGHVGAVQYACASAAASAQRASNMAMGFQCTDGGASYSRVPNVYTAGCSCPAGFTAHARGRVKAPEGRQWGATQYVCVNNVVTDWTA